MNRFRVFETKEFQRALDAVDEITRNRIQRKLQDQIYPQLREQPFWGPNVKRLRNWDPPLGGSESEVGVFSTELIRKTRWLLCSLWMLGRMHIDSQERGLLGAAGHIPVSRA